jgi:hypothetical protein
LIALNLRDGDRTGRAASPHRTVSEVRASTGRILNSRSIISMPGLEDEVTISRHMEDNLVSQFEYEGHKLCTSLGLYLA